MAHLGLKILLLLTLMCFPSDTTLSQSDKKKGSKKKPKIELSIDNVILRGLVQENPKSREIIQTHASYCDTEREIKHFQGDTLAYVTPWNGKGYDIAKLFGHKFTYVSPVWLQLQRKFGGGYSMEGTHDIDKNWVQEVQNSRSLVVPRVLFDGWTARDYQALFSNEREQQECIKHLLKTIKQFNFDGLVIEVLSQMGGQRSYTDLQHFLGHLHDDMRALNKKLILVFPPPIYQDNKVGLFNHQLFAEFLQVVDSVSLMTYDYSNPARPGPNSPYEWVRQCVELLAPERDDSRGRILVGLNFFGNDYYPSGGGPILGSQYIELLSKHKTNPVWNSRDKEHYLTYKSGIGEHVVYYPSLKSIHDRVKLAEELGTGISIWEIGQGLDYFYDLL